MVCSACAAYRPPLAPPLTCQSNISGFSLLPPQPPPSPHLRSTTVVAGASQHHCSMQVYFLFPVCSFLLFSGWTCLVCMCLCLVRNACMPHAVTCPGVQVSRCPGDTVQQVPAAPPENSERILNRVETLKLSMCPNGACSFLSASLSLLAGGEEREGRACLPACLQGAGLHLQPRPFFASCLLSGFLCMSFFQPASEELLLLFKSPPPKKKPFSPSEPSQEETHSPCRRPWC